MLREKSCMHQHATVCANFAHTRDTHKRMFVCVRMSVCFCVFVCLCVCVCLFECVRVVFFKVNPHAQQGLVSICTTHVPHLTIAAICLFTRFAVSAARAMCGPFWASHIPLPRCLPFETISRYYMRSMNQRHTILTISSPHTPSTAHPIIKSNSEHAVIYLTTHHVFFHHTSPLT